MSRCARGWRQGLRASINSQTTQTADLAHLLLSSFFDRSIQNLQDPIKVQQDQYCKEIQFHQHNRECQACSITLAEGRAMVDNNILCYLNIHFMDLKRGGDGLQEISSFVLLKMAEFALKDTKSTDNPAMTSSGKEQNPGKTSSGQSTDFIASYRQVYISNPLIREQVDYPGRNPAPERWCLLISITTAPSSVPASHGSISPRHKIADLPSFSPGSLLAVSWGG